MTTYYSFTDLQLVDLLKDSDDAAFTEIYHRYAEKLTGFASAKLYNLEEPRDIIHDVFVKLWEERKTLTITRNLEAYLFTLVRYRVIDKIRKNITREDYTEMMLALQTSLAAAPEQQMAVKKLKEHFAKALDKLSPRVKEIYLLSREAHLSIPEIADKLQLSEQTVKNQLTVALKHLRESLTLLSASALVAWCLH
ncbi:RNA polymerase sigma-70 factor [Chitinophaga arvensicola]|uniref:RNA polymerase sigma-70 factor, ECF subfamily n=1 Tax=Chitinophaga arvensicola TaxID=29529 RepID=A0A1I0R1Y5_9BACT|nr:RNA polymerase sigma-70 factor [Chitinophaga arvensicola]SEW34333.1 RNA polymerase sigma-70 factor, ECF subfamily [Chitinophaga arvensicola]